MSVKKIYINKFFDLKGSSHGKVINFNIYYLKSGVRILIKKQVNTLGNKILIHPENKFNQKINKLILNKLGENRFE